MKLVNGVLVIAVAAGLLAGCSSGYSPVEMLNRAQPVGSPFTKYLAIEYKTVANRFHGKDAEYFAKKGLAAVDGVIVEPERLEGRDLDGAGAAEMAEARGELITLLNGGGRDRAPDTSAVAQTRFDCWLTLRGGTWMSRREVRFPDENMSCQEQFRTALNVLRHDLEGAQPPVMSPPAAPAPPTEEFPAPIISMQKGSQTAVPEMSFLVFFDWDKHTVSPGADDVLETVAHEIKSRSDINEVIVGGYTDTSGGEKYNMKLSLKRADTVRERLVFYGVPVKKIRIVAHGQNDQLVRTPHGVREAQNRRAQITFN